MGIEDNKDVVRRMVDECVNLHRSEILDQFVDRGIRVHPGTPGAAPDGEGIDALREAFQRFRTTFPDLHVGLDQVLAEDDLVAARWTATGTHTGPWGAIAPTGRPISFSGVNIFRFERGKVAEIWNHRDDLGLMTQLGAVTMNAGPSRT